MPSFRYALLLILVSVLIPARACAQKSDTTFPSDEEIKLVLTQTERAVGQYKLLLDMEEKAFGKEGVEAVAKDREVVRGLEAGIVGFRKNPQAFNGPLGFSFFEWIDDASRNAALTAQASAALATVALIDGDKDKMQLHLGLSKDFANISGVFYTVSENAGALYTRYVQGIEQAAELGVKTATECSDILKKSKAKPQQ